MSFPPSHAINGILPAFEHNTNSPHSFPLSPKQRWKLPKQRLLCVSGWFQEDPPSLSQRQGQDTDGVAEAQHRKAGARLLLPAPEASACPRYHGMKRTFTKLGSTETFFWEESPSALSVSFPFLHLLSLLRDSSGRTRDGQRPIELLCLWTGAARSERTQPACGLSSHVFVHLLLTPGRAQTGGREDHSQVDGCNPATRKRPRDWRSRSPAPPHASISMAVCVCRCRHPKGKLGEERHTQFFSSLAVALVQPRRTSLCNLGSRGFAGAGELVTFTNPQRE